MRVAEAIETDAKTERELRALSKGRRVQARVQQRARLILLAAQGWRNKDIAEEVKLDRRQVALWRRRFIEGGVQALLQDAPRSGRAPRPSCSVSACQPVAHGDGHALLPRDSMPTPSARDRKSVV